MSQVAIFGGLRLVFILASGTMMSRSEMLNKTLLPPEKGGCITWAVRVDRGANGNPHSC